MKLWLLSPYQAVFYSYFRLGFCDKHRSKDLILRLEQFRQLHDIMVRHRRGSYNLGRGFRVKLSEHGLRIQHRQVSFAFDDKSWRCYKNKVHWRIHSFLKHELRNRQRDARAASRHPHRHRSRSSSPARQQVASRTTPNGGGQNEQWSQSPTVSKRLHSNSGTNFSFRRAVHELRNSVSPSKTVSSRQNADFDDEEFSSLCTIEDEHSASSSEEILRPNVL